MSPPTRSIADDAAEYGAHVKHGGWRLGLLVARSVENNGKGSANVRPHIAGKVSAAEFARQSGTTHTRVLRYLEAWERAAAASRVPAASALVPGVDVALPDDEELPWRSFYTPEGPRNVRDPDRLAALEAEADEQGVGASKVKDVASNPKAMAAAILADPATADAARNALDERIARSLPSRADPPRPPRSTPNAIFDILAEASTANMALRRLARLYEAAAAHPDPGVWVTDEGRHALRRLLLDVQGALDLLLAVLDGAPADLSSLFEADR